MKIYIALAKTRVVIHIAVKTCLGDFVTLYREWSMIQLTEYRMIMRHCLLIMMLFWSLTVVPMVVASPEIPGAAQVRPIVLSGATIHPVSGETIPAGELLLDAGRIVALGRHVDVPPDTKRVDVAGKHIYPGLFDAYTQMGLVEINAVRATNDRVETGEFNSNVRAEVAVNPDSELIPVTRSAGVLLCLTAPQGQLVSGSSSVMQLDGWTWEEMALRRRVAMHLDWPRMMPLTDWWVEESKKDQIQKRDDQLKALDQFMLDARAFANSRADRTVGEVSGALNDDVRLQAMIPVWEHQIPLLVQADEVQQIQAAVAFALREKVKLVLLGGYDAPRCAKLLVKHEIPVIVGGVYRLPRRRHDAHDAPFTLPARLRQAGIRFCIASLDRFGPSNVRNLPYHAAMAVAHGLAYDEALKAVTLYPAQILGVDDRIGSLEPGKDATLIITDGDPLEAGTHIEAALIQGRPVDLSNRHKRLWKKYQEKYKRLE